MTLHTDLPTPPITDLIARARECRASAVRLKDDATVRQLDRLIDKLPTARLCWQLGTLIVGSPSGQSYHVSRAGCDCLNARRCGKRACWHLALHELLLDLFSTACDTADMEAECVPPGTEPGDDLPDEIPPIPRRSLGARIAVARRAVAYAW